MASSNGSAIVAPARSRRNLRRGKDFFVINMIKPISFYLPIHSISWFVTARQRESSALLLFRRTARSHLERRTLHDAQDDGAEPVIVLRSFPVNSANNRHFRIVHAPPQGIRDQPFGDGIQKHGRTAQDGLAQIGRPSHVSPVPKYSGGVHGFSVLCVGPPFADRIKVLQRKSWWIDDLVANCTSRGRAVLLHSLPYRARGSARRVIGERWNIGRRWRRRNAQQRRQQPLAPFHRRSACRCGRNRQNARVTEQAPAILIGD